MKVSELILLLQDCNQDDEVRDGDYEKTIVAVDITTSPGNVLLILY